VFAHPTKYKCSPSEHFGDQFMLKTCSSTVQLQLRPAMKLDSLPTFLQIKSSNIWYHYNQWMAVYSIVLMFYRSRSFWCIMYMINFVVRGRCGVGSGKNMVGWVLKGKNGWHKRSRVYTLRAIDVEQGGESKSQFCSFKDEFSCFFLNVL